MTAMERVRAALNGEPRTVKGLAERCGLPAHTVSGCLGALRRQGHAEFVNRGSRSWWRAPADHLPAGESADELGGQRKA
jgi:hypothetical protein